jgi:hypothetical protein
MWVQARWQYLQNAEHMIKIKAMAAHGVINLKAGLWIRIRIHRIHMFLGLPDPDPLIRGMDPDPALDPDPCIIMQK